MTPSEIDDKPLGRAVCGERIVFYRGPDGRATALEDWCPHRGAPLSLGRVAEGKLVCGYHGLEMGCDGKAVAMIVEQCRRQRGPERGAFGASGALSGSAGVPSGV